MSTEQQPTRPSRGGGPTAPVGSTVAIVVAVVAVVLGFLILRDIRDDDSSAGSTPDSTTPNSQVVDTSSTLPPTTTTPLTLVGAKVVVANASGIGQTAGKWTTALQTRGFQTGEATNSPERLDVSKIYYAEGGQLVAQSLATVLRLGAPEPMPATVPTEAGNIGDASVLLMLGKDIADKALADVEAGTTTTPTPSSSAAPAAG